MLKRAKKGRGSLGKLKNRKKLIEHMIRGKRILLTVLRDTVGGRRRRGRKSLKAIDDEKNGYHKRTKELVHKRKNW